MGDVAPPTPSPLEGEGWGGGYANCDSAKSPPSRQSLTASALSDLPLKGGGERSAGLRDEYIQLAGTSLLADRAGALYWPEEGLLVVSDLHLEKGSSFARRGMLLPPYDTGATLGLLRELAARYAPRLVIALGDSFHDGDGPARLSDVDRATLTGLQRGRDWLWIAGNHDPEPAENIGGHFATVISIGPLTFRHEPSRNAPDGEIAGHLHPMARIASRGRAVARRCFATDGRAMVMPACGAYAGGLNVRHAAFATVFGSRAFTAHMLGDRRLYAFGVKDCLG